MTRKSRRELERQVDDLGGDPDDMGRPFSDEERAALGDDADAWAATRKRRAIARALMQAARRARGGA